MLKIAQDNEILRGVVGSTAHGLEIKGQDDRDEMGVFVEPPDCVCGLQTFDHYIYRDKPEGVRSEAGDLDLTLYSLRKFCRLAAKGNPSVLILLWIPEHVIKNDAGQRLVDLRDAFISRHAGQAFLGYLVSQKRALKGERSKKVNRPELAEKFGYDTKYAAHALRLGFEGIEYLSTHQLTLPIAEPNLSILRAIRQGQITLAETLDLIEGVEEKLRTLADACLATADIKRINQFLINEHWEHWNV